MGIVRFDPSHAASFAAPEEWSQFESAVRHAHFMLHEKTGSGHEYLGWIDLPVSYDKSEFSRIKQVAEQIAGDSDVLLVIGIGGSYLGARAVLDGLGHSFHNILGRGKRMRPEIYFVGNSISSVYLDHLLEVIEGKDISINVISKSGTTLEPAIAFRLFRAYMEKKYGKEKAKKRIYATTDRERGALRQMAQEEGYECFVIPDDVGGRYSVLTAVGLLPMAVGGVDLDALMSGAADARQCYLVHELMKNECYQYAAIRNVLYRKGKAIELLVHYEPQLRYFAEWWKQLFGESEGKGGLGIFPASAEYSADLHSLGQYVQEGVRHLFETVLHVDRPQRDVVLPPEDMDRDGLNFLAGLSMNQVNRKAFEGTLLAHLDGGVPNLIVSIPEMNAYHLGWLIYFFKKACGISGYLLGVNPFDQPGVELYKANMFALLGKPGHEQRKHELETKLQGRIRHVSNG